jgi:hypothetical protein
MAANSIKMDCIEVYACQHKCLHIIYIISGSRRAFTTVADDSDSLLMYTNCKYQLLNAKCDNVNCDKSEHT